MDAKRHNGSFELPVAGDDYMTGAIPGWKHPTGEDNFRIRRPSYLDGATEGKQSLNVMTLAGWQSDVLTDVSLVPGSSVYMSVDFGWDSWVNETPSSGVTTYLYAVNPTNFNDQALLLSFTGTPQYTGFGTDAGWITASRSAIVPDSKKGWHLQVVIASGGDANNMIDNVVITTDAVRATTDAIPEYCSLGLVAAGFITLWRRRRDKEETVTFQGNKV